MSKDTLLSLNYCSETRDLDRCVILYIELPIVDR
jgi:hypothetical protein